MLKLKKGEKIVVHMMFGSHLYGTNNDDSDVDYKGVFLPAYEDILLSRVNKSYSFNTKTGNDKNTSEDIDSEIYSLHYFIKLAIEGQTVALDMLHAPYDMIIEHSTIWDLIVANRDKFYTKNLKAFIGYARRQAAKYGIKGSRLNTAREVLDFIRSKYLYYERLSELWDELPLIEHVHKLRNVKNDLREYQVCGKKFQETARISYVVPILESFVDSYGERARQAANNENIDWKAVSHAIRAAYQVRELLTENTITFPLKNAKFIKEVKEGKHDYTTIVAPHLESVMDEVEDLSLKSNLPERPDQKFWDSLVCSIIEENCL